MALSRLILKIQPGLPAGHPNITTKVFCLFVFLREHRFLVDFADLLMGKESKSRKTVTVDKNDYILRAPLFWSYTVQASSH